MVGRIGTARASLGIGSALSLGHVLLVAGHVLGIDRPGPRPGVESALAMRPLVNRNRVRRPWFLLSAAVLLFVARGVAAAPDRGGRDGAVLLTDMVTLAD